MFWSILYFLSQERTSSTYGWPKMKAARKVAAPRPLMLRMGSGPEPRWVLVSLPKLLLESWASAPAHPITCLGGLGVQEDCAHSFSFSWHDLAGVSEIKCVNTQHAVKAQVPAGFVNKIVTEPPSSPPHLLGKEWR